MYSLQTPSKTRQWDMKPIFGKNYLDKARGYCSPLATPLRSATERIAKLGVEITPRGERQLSREYALGARTNEGNCMIPEVKDWLPIVVRKTDKILNPKGLSIEKLYTRAPSLRTNIPNVVYQTWKFPRLSAPHARKIQKFRNRNRDFSFEFFDDDRAASYMEENYSGQPILDVFRYVKVPAARADLWRYCVLLKEGGMYCDIDSLIKVPLRTFLEGNPSEVLSFEGSRWEGVLAPGEFADGSVFRSQPSPQVRGKLDFPDHTILNWFLAFAPGHPALQETIDVIVENFPFFKDRIFDPVWRGVIHSTGPLAFTQGVWRWLDRSPVRPVQRGIDFNGEGVFKIPGDGERDRSSPNYRDMKARALGA